MSSPAKVTDSASAFRRLPSHAEHSVPDINRETRRFISSLGVVAKVCSTYLRALVNVPW